MCFKLLIQAQNGLFDKNNLICKNFPWGLDLDLSFLDWGNRMGATLIKNNSVHFEFSAPKMHYLSRVCITHLLFQ